MCHEPIGRRVSRDRIRRFSGLELSQVGRSVTLRQRLAYWVIEFGRLCSLEGRHRFLASRALPCLAWCFGGGVMSALIVIAFFFCSLMASYVLFKLLKSTARVGGNTRQAGGALAGFVIIFAAMEGAYIYISGNELQQARLASTEKNLQNRLDKAEADLALKNQQLEVKEIAGKIQPNLVETKVVLAIAATDLDVNGIFRIDGRCLDLADDLRLYFIREGRHVFQFLQALPPAGDEFDVTQLAGGQ